MPKTLVIFDIDGTLLFSNKVDSQCFADTYEELYSDPFPTIDWTKYPHVVDDTIFGTVIQDRFGRKADHEEMQVFKDVFVSKIRYKRLRKPELFEEVPGAVNIIEYLQNEEDVLLGIGTGGWRQPAMVKLEHLKFDTTDMFMSFADGHISRESILNASIDMAKTQHANIERIVYVGDAVWDVKTTRNLDLPFIGIRKEGDLEVLKNIGASHVLKDYLEPQKFLEYLQEARAPKTE